MDPRNSAADQPVDIMKINGRLLLLAVATGLFIRIWSGGTPPRKRTAGVRRPSPVATLIVYRTASGITAHREDPLGELPIRTADDELRFETGHSPDSTGSEPSRSTAENPVEEWTENDAPIAIPAHLPAGDWRIVDGSGRIARLTVTRENAASTYQAAEFLSEIIDGRRWYFIRLMPETTASAAADSTVAEVEIPSASLGSDSPIEETLDVESPRPARRELSPEELAEIEAFRVDVQAAAEAAAEPSNAEPADGSSGNLEASIAAAASRADGGAALLDPLENAAAPASTDQVGPETVVSGNRKFDFSGFGAESDEIPAPERPIAPALPESVP